MCDSHYAKYKTAISPGFGVFGKTFLNNALGSLWIQSIWSSWAAPRYKQTIFRRLKLLFNRELIQTADSPRERKEIKLNPLNLYLGTDSFIFESLAASHANKKLLKCRINTEQGCVCSGSRVHNWQTEAMETLQLQGLLCSEQCWMFSVAVKASRMSPLALSLCQISIQ